MKRFFSTAFVLMFIGAGVLFAKAKDDSKYLKGAVPMENGMVCFQKSFSVPGRTDQELQETLMQFIRGGLVENAIQEQRSRIISDGKEDGNICAAVEEWMIFKKKFAYLDETRFRYQVIGNVNKGRISLTIKQISFLYGEECEENVPTGRGGTTYRAEEWIDDAHAINKKGTKLIPGSAKFRRKTVDRVETIFEDAMDCFEEDSKQAEIRRKEQEKARKEGKQAEEKPQPKPKKVRAFVKE